MILRVVIGLVTLGLVAIVRARRRRSRRDAATPATLTMRSSYSGLENPMYRVEIHRGGEADGVTFTWSRDGDRRAAQRGGAVQRGTWFGLEDGIEIRFDDGGTFAVGDFWTFPARTAADTVTLNAQPRGAASRSRARSSRASARPRTARR